MHLAASSPNVRGRWLGNSYQWSITTHQPRQLLHIPLQLGDFALPLRRLALQVAYLLLFAVGLLDLCRRQMYNARLR